MGIFFCLCNTGTIWWCEGGFWQLKINIAPGLISLDWNIWNRLLLTNVDDAFCETKRWSVSFQIYFIWYTALQQSVSSPPKKMMTSGLSFPLRHGIKVFDIKIHRHIFDTWYKNSIFSCVPIIWKNILAWISEHGLVDKSRRGAGYRLHLHCKCDVMRQCGREIYVGV